MYNPLISVVIPAYNAGETIDATLMSVRRQTYRALEIIVVVDGATDDTEAVARRHADEDGRILVLVTPNRGVAAARNAGAAASSGAFIAPVDADDLWHPDKIRRQLNVFDVGGSRMGCVYSPFRLIDMKDVVIHTSPQPYFCGALFLRSLYINFVGNGSALLIRREAFEQVGGYETRLRAMGLEGAEDRLIQILLARRWLTGVAPDYLIGYRRRPGAMSSNVNRTMRSTLAALDMVAQRHPETPRDHIRSARAIILTKLARALFRIGNVSGALEAFARALRESPIMTLDAVRSQASRKLERAAGKLSPGALRGQPFLSCDPSTGVRRWSETPLGAHIRRLEAEDRALFAGRDAPPNAPSNAPSNAPPNGSPHAPRLDQIKQLS